jgi:two-component system sensor kinase FixL
MNYLYKSLYNTGNIKGTILGHSIMKKYIELLDGKIYFESQANKGSSFSFSFPQLNQMA